VTKYLLHIEHDARPAITIRGLSFNAAWREVMKHASVCVAQGDDSSVPVRIVIKQERE
jgi:hypothetical protein